MEIAEIVFQHCHDSLWRVELALASLTAKPAESCGSLAESCGVLAESCGELRATCGKAAGACGKAAGACGKAAGACGKAAGACGKAAGACGSLQQGAATPREILFQARIQARGLSEFRYKRL
ncbi:hypothetical protein QL285_002138 [Trifolium repens]|nr:hypothetical protein QL285_044190 [Trifolium repens]KAK2408700.1 hypothetical protein QL285_044191 [Trifolium repens]KAK2454594.1 hypothetical protein QL285_002138 [Trifolium repens]